jgi:RNA polymerase sigma factor (TIGR02999 family)
MSGNVTGLLRRWRDGERSALDALVPLVYGELHRIADAHVRREYDPESLQPTALVHEAFIKLVGGAEIDWRDRSHFLAIAARMMRQILVDRGRRRHAHKRDGGERLTLTSLDVADEPRDVDLLALDQALVRLAEIDERKARIVELRVFGGLEFAEIGEVMELSRATLDREFRTARVWLFHEVGGAGPAP